MLDFPGDFDMIIDVQIIIGRPSVKMAFFIYTYIINSRQKPEPVRAGRLVMSLNTFDAFLLEVTP